MRRETAESATRIVLIVDLVGSTSWRVDHGDAEADQMLIRFERAFEDIVGSHDGRVVANHGDGFLSSFGSATKALEAAARFRRALDEIPLPDGMPALRAGLAAGDVIERGREMYGLPVVEAARLEAAAEPGQIVCSELVRALSGTRAPVAFTDRRDLELKGLPEPVAAWTVDSSPLGAAGVVATTGLGGWRDHLPVGHGAFLGRGRDLEEVSSLALGQPIVTLVGTGGVGKTRLSIEVAQHIKGAFADGVWFVSLEAARGRSEVVSAIGRSLRLPGSATDAGADGLRRALDPMNGLLILDNCEQSIGPIGEIVRELTGPGSRLHVLCTSREALGLRAEVVRPLQPLSFPGDADDPGLLDSASVALFVDRARGLDATRRFDDDELRHVAHIVRRVEGLPLAIELAAARLNVLSVAEISERTDSSFALLSQRNPDRPRRHHTISATVDWSVSLLSEPERCTLIGLAQFAGGATLDAIEAVCPRNYDSEVLDRVAGLVDKSLVRRQADGRFSMLASVREPLIESAEVADRVAEARLLHLDYFERLARTSGANVQHDPLALNRFSLEHDNFNAALSTALDVSKTRALKLAGRLALYWVLAGRAGEGDRRLAEVLSAPGDVEPAVLANALRGAAMAAGLGARYVRSEELLLESRTIYERLGRAESVAYCDYWLARNTVVQVHFGHLDDGHLDGAWSRLSSAIEVFDGAGDGFGVLLAHPYLGWVRLLERNFDEADRLSVELLELANASGVGRVEAYARAHVAYVRLCMGDLDRVSGDLDLSLSVLEVSGDTQNLVIMWCVRTALELRRGDDQAAIDAARRLVEQALACDSTEWEALVFALSAHVLADRGDWSAAGTIVRTLEEHHPNWRTPMRHLGLEPDRDLSHAMTFGGGSSVLAPAAALRAVAAALNSPVPGAA